jgi:nucleotide-binding universal stress UspA family protein
MASKTRTFRILVATDGSDHARAAITTAATVARQVKRTNARRERAATRELNRAAIQLQHAGWRTRTVLTRGEPLRDLLGTLASTRAQLLVVGARGSSGVRHLLLGSVAEGALNRSPVPVLIAR